MLWAQIVGDGTQCGTAHLSYRAWNPAVCSLGDAGGTPQIEAIGDPPFVVAGSFLVHGPWDWPIEQSLHSGYRVPPLQWTTSVLPAACD